MLKSESNPWQTLRRKNIYHNPWITVEEHDVMNPAGNETIYGIVQFSHYAIGILPVDTEGNTWLIGQYRYPVNEYTWEIPEGGGDIAIDPLISAQRELLEEAGIKAEKWTLLQELQLSNSVTDEYGFIYLAENLSFENPNPDEDEDLQVIKISLADAYQLVLNGAIKDSLTVIALLKAKILFGF